MNTQRIEGIGVTTINEFVFNSNVLIPHLDFNDRTDSWDGYIFVYSNGTNKKSELLGKIPVQIKTSNIKPSNGKTKSKSFDISDLNNYKNDGGVIIFYIECNANRKKIYFASLLPYDLDKLLNNLKLGQNKKSITLTHIRNKDIHTFEKLCRDFLIHRKRQYSLPLIDFPHDKIKDFLITGTMLAGSDLDEILLSDSHYLYGKTHLDSLLYDCVTKINIKEISKTMEKPILIADKQYFPNYKVKKTKDVEQILFGNNIELNILKNKTKFVCTMSKSLDERINDIEFLCKIFEKKTLQIAHNTITLIEHSNDKLTQIERELKESYNHLNNIAVLLDIFKINHSAFDFDAITEDDDILLNYLINVMILNYPVEQEGVPGKFVFKIGKMKFLTFIKKNQDLRVEVHDINDSSLRLTINDPESEVVNDVRIYLMLNSDDLLCSNIRISEVREGIESHEHIESYDNRVLLSILEIIKAYDKGGGAEYLECAYNMLLWLENGKYINENIININKLQINKRQRKFNPDEINYLNRLKDEFKDDISMLCGISILLEETERIDQYYNELTPDNKIEFANYPIYSLINTDNQIS